jgi:hypothetical protein
VRSRAVSSSSTSPISVSLHRTEDTSTDLVVADGFD